MRLAQVNERIRTMNTRRIFLSVFAYMICVNGWVIADTRPDAREMAADKARYQNLMREIKAIEVDHARTLKQAMSETQATGAASLETKSRLLSLRDRRDRLIDRVTLIALRHGWKIPGTQMGQPAEQEMPEGQRRIFEPADQMIRDRFAKHARAIVARVPLPVIPIESERRAREVGKGKEKKWLIF